MIPDLRFVVGAVIATALLGVMLFGLAAAMHISHQSKISPLEASRLLAYTPESRHRIFDVPAPRLDSPFANIPADPNPVPLQQPAEPAAVPLQTAATAQPTPDAQPPASDADTVDERAVVEPPLPPDGDPPAASAESAPAAPPPEAAAAAAPPIETTPAPPAPVAEQTVATPDVEPVGSIPPTTAAAVAETQEPAKAKRKRTARKAKPRRPAPRTAAQVDPFGYPVGTTSTANRPAQGFWGPFN
jgi:hypothetical protein